MALIVLISSLIELKCGIEAVLLWSQNSLSALLSYFCYSDVQHLFWPLKMVQHHVTFLKSKLWRCCVLFVELSKEKKNGMLTFWFGLFLNILNKRKLVYGLLYPFSVIHLFVSHQRNCRHFQI